MKDGLPAPSGEGEESKGLDRRPQSKAPHTLILPCASRFTNDASRTTVCGAELLGSDDLKEFDFKH